MRTLYARHALVVVPMLWLGLATPAGSQTNRSDPVDFHSRFGAGLNVDMPDGWEADLEYELRMVDNASSYRGSYVTTELGRDLSDHFRVFGSYRLGMVDEGAFHRFAGGAQAATELGDAELSFRPMIQYQRQRFEDEDQSTDEDLFLRTRFRAEYALSDRLDVYASTEPYFTFASEEFPVDNLRNMIGFELEYLRGRAVNVYYMYRPDFAKSYNRTFHTLGVNLQFEVDMFKRKRPRPKDDGPQI